MPNIFSRVSFLEKLLFTKHLAVMVRAGIPLAEAINTLILQTNNSTFRKILKMLLADLQNGQSFAKSLKKHGAIFDDFYTGLIEVGEEAGTLEKNLDFLSRQLSKEYAMNKKIQGAMLYPALIFGATLCVGAFLAFYIMPQLLTFFESFDVELPLITKILLFIASLMKNYGIIIFAALAASGTLLYMLIQIPQIKYVWHIFLLKLPIFGKLLCDSQLARFSRNLGVLLQSGVPVARSLDITVVTLSNLKFRKDLIEIKNSLVRGKDMADAIDKYNFFEYPPLVAKMIAVGEKTGKLEEVLLYLGDYFEEEIDDAAKNMSTIIEPVMLIVIGFAVGFVALAIISPIYQLTGSIK